MTLRPRWLRPVLATVLVLAVVGAVAWVLLRDHTPTRRLVAHFTSAVGITAGSDVRVLGVKIGRVSEVTPQGTTVRVTMNYDAKYAIPAAAQAVIIPPSVVSDRYVQLTPAYSGGPAMPDNADLPTTRTGVPMELDDVYRALDEFNKMLGPNGANSTGALSDLVNTGAANLNGNGKNLHDTIQGLSGTLRALADGRDDLFGTITNLQTFVTVLAQSDQQVRQFNDRLATAGEELAGEGPELSAMLRSLSIALAQITTFLRENRELLTSNVGALTDVTNVLVRQQNALIEALDVAPLALSDLNLAYNASSGTLDTRDNQMGPYGPAAYVCSLMVSSVPVQQIPAQCAAVAKDLNARGLPVPDALRQLAGLPKAKTPSTPSTPSAPSAGGAAPSVPNAGGNDPTLGGILPGTK